MLQHNTKGPKMIRGLNLFHQSQISTPTDLEQVLLTLTMMYIAEMPKTQLIGKLDHHYNIFIVQF